MILVDASMTPFPETKVPVTPERLLTKCFMMMKQKFSHDYIFGPIQFTPMTEDGNGTMNFYNGRCYAGGEYGEGLDKIGKGQHRIVVAKRGILSDEQSKAIRMAYNNTGSDDEVTMPDMWEEQTDEYDDEDEEDDEDEVSAE